MQADKPAEKKGPAATSPNGADKTPVGDAREAGEPGSDTDVDSALPLEDLKELPQRCADAEAKASEYYDRYVRTVAEMENLRRRLQDDVARAHKFGIEGFAEGLLAVRDSLEMALKVEKPSVESLIEGAQVTLRQLDSVFERNKVVAIDPLGEKFDPNRHQAISTIAAGQTKPPVQPDHVAVVLQKGYLIHDRILRPALVIVAQG
ncbi:MAG: nucleotide exchange factor GrpE [Burkholderiaceae bacterium]|nr:nucleotide exchange factor GrpE [Burkholderiaceae bacterium]